MSQPKSGFMAFVLSLFVLGLMTVACSAQAETGATWRVNGSAISSKLLPQLEITEIENKSASLSFTTKGGTSILVLCTATKFTEGGKLTINGGISLGRIKGSGCSVLLNETAAPQCKPHSPGMPAGEILSEKFTGLIILDKEEELKIIKEGKEEVIFDRISNLVKITPENSAGETSKLYLQIELGEECAIGSLVKVETTKLGEGLWLKDIGGNTGFSTEAVTHLVVEGLSTMLALGQPAKTIGSATLKLSGEHTGLKWSGAPA